MPGPVVFDGLDEQRPLAAAVASQEDEAREPDDGLRVPIR